MAVDLTQLTPVLITLNLDNGQPIPLTLSESTSCAIYVAPIEICPVSLNATTPFISPSGLTIM
jgi:hypothetical protein